MNVSKNHYKYRKDSDIIHTTCTRLSESVIPNHFVICMFVYFPEGQLFAYDSEKHPLSGHFCSQTVMLITLFIHYFSNLWS